MTKAKTLATLVSNNNPLADGTLSVGDVTGLQAELDAKQAALVSGTNIKTINGTSVLGSGDIQIDGGVVSFNTRTGAVTLSSSDVTAALGYTPATSGDISSAISALVDTAPATLDTLNELAAAIGDDPNFATTITNSLAGKQATLVSGTNIKTVNGTSILGSGNIQIDGGVTSFNTRTGAVTLSSSDVTTALGYTPYNSTNPSGYITSSASITGNAATATALQTARTINGVSFDGSANITVADATKLPLAGGTMTGAITFAAGQTWPTFNQNTTGSAATVTSIGATQVTNLYSPNNTTVYTNPDSAMPGTGASLIHALSYGPSSNDGHMLSMSWASTASYGAQLWIDTDPTRQIAFRQRSNAGVWNSWNYLLHDGNYNSYSPTLTGGGASGTWGISISGNAGTAYGLNVHTGRNNEANKVVRTDGNGYIQAGWINTDSGDNGTTSLARIYASQDGYIRYYTPANFNTVKNRAVFNRESNGGTMVAGNIYSIYTGGGALTMYLPTVANTAQGDTIWITNLHMTWAANNFTIGKNGNTYINYIAESLVCNVNVAGLTLVCNYHDGTNAFWSAF